jgi:exopolyphosphatase/guanosine-5'-triphosphate,3'-diphosphate pyrophosphatase
MRVGAIDIGTNSTRLLVAEEAAGGFRPLERRMQITRLGEGVDRSKLIAGPALERTLAVIADYAATCGELEVERLRVIGTSAARDARNRNELFAGVEALTGRPPELLSGEDEARITFLGATSDLAADGEVMVVDIGGGSTELVAGRAGVAERLVSLDIGCVRLFEKHLASDPPAAAELAALRAEASAALESARAELGVGRGGLLVGVAGTVTQLALLQAGAPVYDPDVTHHAVLSHGAVRSLARRLASLPYDKRRRIKGLEPGRADVIVAGTEILLAVLEVFDRPEVIASERDILDGLVLEMLENAAR